MGVKHEQTAEQRPKVAVLIGAGASYGAGGATPETPPLGAELLTRLQKACPSTWGSLLSAAEIEAFQGDPPFERGMKMVWENGGRRVQPMLIEMARYFSRFSSSGTSLYEQLPHVLQNAGVWPTFCSLNYECLFEQVAHQTGVSLAHIGEQLPLPDPPFVCIFKPHGSCNYIAPMTHNVSHSVMADSPAFLDSAGGPFEVMDCAKVEPLYDQVGLSFPPVMSLYSPDKHSPVSPTTVEAVREGWAEACASMTAIVTIGTRPVLEDNHVWDPVIAASVPVWFVGGKDSAYEQFRGTIGDRAVHVASTFKDAICELQRLLDVSDWTQAWQLPASKRFPVVTS